MDRVRKIIRVLLAGLLLAQTIQYTAFAADTSKSDSAATDAAGWITSPAGYSQPTNQLRLLVGYFGGPYYEKAVFYVDGDNRMLWTQDGTQVSSDEFYVGTFSYVDEGDQVVVTNAYGISLAGLLELAGVDGGSVQWMHFRTTDNKTLSMTYENLCGLQRYYYPALNEYAILDDYEDFADEIRGNGLLVEPMLALQDDWNSETMINHAMRLLFGQTNPVEVRSGESGKYVHTIILQLGGTPALNTTVDLDSKVGSLYQVTVNLAAITDDGRTTRLDTTVAQQVAEGLRVTSSNRNAVDVTDMTVNEDGSITVTIKAGDGTAELSIEAGGYSGAVLEAGITVSADGGGLSVLDSDGNVTVTGGGSGEAPPSGDDEKSPGADDGEENPGGDDEEPPSGDDGEKTPGTDNGEENPGADDGEKTPGTDDGEKTPGANDGEENPGGNDEKSPGADDGEENPSGNDEKSPGADDGEENPNADNGKVSPNADDGEETPDADSASEEPAGGTPEPLALQSQDQDTPHSDSETLGDTEIPETPPDETALTQGVTPETEKAETVNSILVHPMTIDSDQGGVQNWRKTAMAEDAVPMGEETDNRMLPVAAAAAALLLLLGGGQRYCWYRWERKK